MLDYKSIITKRYALGMSYKELAEESVQANPESTTSYALLKNAKSCRILFRKGSRITRSMNWSTGMNPEPIIGVLIMSSPILQRCISRWKNVRT